ncbi:intraflagellar transport protein 22 homolog [Clytia hemisphaerica]|uniref:intraflagellar transport protein 22 homolog n=1 Tax=Clytia hemisphaerica TaxID=252671 RepID=UPI0034D4BA8D
MFNKVKILVVGPSESGKTVISNFLADATESAGGDYHPTQGVRILEFEVDNLEMPGGSESIEVELWDCSGDNRFEMCWPSMQKDSNGVLFVYNPTRKSHESELEKWHLHFAKEQGLRNEQCLMMAHVKPGNENPKKAGIGGSLGKVRCVVTDLDNEPDNVRMSFNLFLRNVVALVSDRREQEELSIIE